MPLKMHSFCSNSKWSLRHTFWKCYFLLQICIKLEFCVIMFFKKIWWKILTVHWFLFAPQELCLSDIYTQPKEMDKLITLPPRGIQIQCTNETAEPLCSRLTCWYCEYLMGSFSKTSYVCDSKLSIRGLKKRGGGKSAFIRHQWDTWWALKFCLFMYR